MKKKIKVIRIYRPAVLALGLLSLAGCEFSATNPRAITQDDLDNAGALTALVTGAVGESDQAYHRSVMLSGLLSDELTAAGTWTSWIQADRQGVIDLYAAGGDGQNIADDWWTPLQRSRRLAEEAYDQVQAYMPAGQREPLAALARLYSGQAYRDIGEYFCRAAYNAGPEVARTESLELAAEHLTEALELASAAGVDSIANAAHLARARVYLSLGQADAALADAQAVPAGFVWYARYREASREFNGAFVTLNQLGQGTVSEELAKIADPRIAVEPAGVAADQVTPRYDQKKFGKTGDVVRGSWQEARLIEAEIRLDRGEVAAAEGLINQVRAAAGVPQVSVSTAAEARQALRAERRYELFLSGERMLDMRRWDLFPVEWSASCVPLPRSEVDNNPNL